MWKRIIKNAFLIGLLVSPFVFSRNSPIPYELPKVLFIRIWIEILIILGIFFFRRKDLDRERDKILIYSVLGFFAVSALSSFTGVDLYKSWLGNYFRGDGIFTLFHLIGLFLLLTFFLENIWIKNIVKVIALSGVVLSFLSVSTWILKNIFGKYEIETWIDGGIGLTFGNPNFLTGYLLLCLPLTVYLLNERAFKEKRIIYLLIWIVEIIAIFLTRAWAGIFGILVFLFLWGVTSFKKYKTRTTWILALAIIILGIIYGVSSLRPTGGTATDSRSRIYIKGVLALAKRPWGYGFANFDRAFTSVDWPMHFEKDIYVDKAHSSILEVGVTTGVIGLFLYLFIITISLRNLQKKNDLLSRCIFVSFLILVLHMQINVVSISEEMVFWIFVAIASTLSKGITPEVRSV